MPEAYIHSSVALRANEKIYNKIKNKNVFIWGAQGPDPLYCYKFFSKNKEYDLNSLASLIHSQDGGLFLQDLILNAQTDIQKDFVAGFVTHYIADIIMHPYVESQSSEGGKFDMPYGHGFCEVSLDSYIHQLERHTMTVRGKEVAPQISDREFSEIAGLITSSLNTVYSFEVPKEEIVKAYKSFKYYHTHWFGTSNKLLRGMVKYVEKHILKKPGILMCHITPCPQPKNGYISEWDNPFTREHQHTSPIDLVNLSVNISAEYLKAVCKYFDGGLSDYSIREIIGNRSFVTGLEAKKVNFEEKDNIEGTIYSD